MKDKVVYISKETDEQNECVRHWFDVGGVVYGVVKYKEDGRLVSKLLDGEGDDLYDDSQELSILEKIRSMYGEVI